MVGVCSGGHKKPVMNNVMEYYWLWLLFVTPVDMWWMYWWICGGCIRVWIPMVGMSSYCLQFLVPSCSNTICLVRKVGKRDFPLGPQFE